MPPDRAHELAGLVEKALPFDQPAQPDNASPMPDDLHYNITIEDADRTHTFNISDSAAPDNLKLLFDFLGEEGVFAALDVRYAHRPTQDDQAADFVQIGGDFIASMKPAELDRYAEITEDRDDAPRPFGLDVL